MVLTELQIQELIASLREQEVAFEPGLTKAECTALEAKFDVRFPPDFRALLQNQLPVGGSWVPWRLALSDSEAADKIQYYSYERLLSGIIWDVNYGHWDATWGNRPESEDEQTALVTERFQTYPRLVPIYSHRYIPSGDQAGHPVFSIVQTDMIYYGFNLAMYLAHEFNFNLSSNFKQLTQPAHVVAEWSRHVENNG